MTTARDTAPRRTHSSALRDTIAEVYKRHYRHWSVDELLCHPREALNLCNLVRRAVKKAIPASGDAAALVDPIILKNLLNARKQSRL